MLVKNIRLKPEILLFYNYCSIFYFSKLYFFKLIWVKYITFPRSSLYCVSSHRPRNTKCRRNTTYDDPHRRSQTVGSGGRRSRAAHHSPPADRQSCFRIWKVWNTANPVPRAPQAAVSSFKVAFPLSLWNCITIT